MGRAGQVGDELGVSAASVSFLCTHHSVSALPITTKHRPAEPADRSAVGPRCDGARFLCAPNGIPAPLNACSKRRQCALIRQRLHATVMEREYAPYPKWFGTAWAKLQCAPALTPLLNAAMDGGGWEQRDVRGGQPLLSPHVATAYVCCLQHRMLHGLATVLFPP